MRDAFKEWAVIVQALGEGRQINIFRKGGIHEGPKGFEIHAEVSPQDAQPVLSEESFATQLSKFHAAREPVPAVVHV